MNKYVIHKFWQHKTSYILQCTLAALIVFIILLAFNYSQDNMVVASIGATTFIVFTTPNSTLAQEKFLVGGYIIGLLVGTACSYLAHHVFVIPHIAMFNIMLAGALAVGISTFLMVILDLAHPPAVAYALGLVADKTTKQAAIAAFVAILLIILFRRLVDRYLINLV
ncbi:MAG: hypothetical protein Tsb005_01190 [Gammaproteobacteria bacterium]